MSVLVIGSGGREHALVWRIHQERPDARIYVAPGNGGTKGLAESVSLKPDEVSALRDFAESRDIGLTIVGPEAPLAEGIVDSFQERGLPIFGPTRAAAQIESSKAFAKELMAEAGIPTADHETFSDFKSAESYIRRVGAPIVVKASGLAAGKGAIVCQDVDDAVDAAKSMMVDRRFGAAGSTVVVEDYLAGEELSILCVTDGTNAQPLPASQDHKPIGEGDTGPNTGGMGAYSPVSIADEVLIGRVMEEIVDPALAYLRDADRTYRGVLYCGLMIVAGAPHVIEFNCRFGDPEAQAVLPVTDTPLLPLMEAIANGSSIEGNRIASSGRAAVCTVLASEGYPGAYTKGRVIRIPDWLEDDPDALVFHAGTRRDPEDQLVTDGGRVMGVVGLADDVEAAAAKSRELADAVEFEGKYFRRDIAYREIQRKRG